ncbi:HK97-gp10 family putative phage morphogenesis protein [Microbulbifer sp. JSM ZJ756]|uniref:HK97-gp10 family putative phage morphogenesis protein n=1 Tax=Microbulbifer sp. JSM ZJ756 TaxID=3376191 RepID=UPI00379FB515
MADSFKFNIDGLAKMNSALLGLEAKTGAAVLRRAGRKAMKPVEEAMRAGARADTGQLKDSIGMQASTAKGRSSGRVARITVGPLKKSSGRGANKKEFSKTNQKAIAQEYGNARQSADPFIRPALENRAESVIGDLVREFSTELTKVKK